MGNKGKEEVDEKDVEKEGLVILGVAICFALYKANHLPKTLQNVV